MTLDVAVIGAGPAGLAAALNLARARRRVVLIDSNRPRNSATFKSHGYPTRDGISPLELRKLGLEEVLAYETAEHRRGIVRSVTRAGDGFVVEMGEEQLEVRAVVLATGLTEVPPALPTLRAFYGTSIHSCIECDGWEKRDAPLALIGETPDLAERAVFLSQWTDDLVVFTNGAPVVSEAEEAALAARGIRLDRRELDDVEGDRDGLTGVRTRDGGVVPRTGGFVRPRYEPKLDYVASLGLELDLDGLVVVDGAGRTSARGVYAAGDLTPPGPQQLIIAAGNGARAALAVNRDLLGLPQAVFESGPSVR